MIWPTLAVERDLGQQGYGAIAGLDEVGRGCLAGPVVAGAVILPTGWRTFVETEATDLILPRWLRDSKTVPETKRLEVATQIHQIAVAWAVGVAEVAEIEDVGIGPATYLAMTRALDNLAIKPDFVLIDGHAHPDVAADRQLARNKADANIASVAAASLVAKVYRDGLMVELDQQHPGYDLATNKGYGTPKHAQAIQNQGLSPIHRMSFCRKW